MSAAFEPQPCCYQVIELQAGLAEAGQQRAALEAALAASRADCVRLQAELAGAAEAAEALTAEAETLRAARTAVAQVRCQLQALHYRLQWQCRPPFSLPLLQGHNASAGTRMCKPMLCAGAQRDQGQAGAGAVRC